VELGSITGAKAPSGEPVREAPRRERPSGPSRFGASGSPRTGGYRGGESSGGYKGRDENRTGGYRGGESTGGYKGRDENRTGATASRTGGFRSRAAGTARD
jgi:hypothetical protein